MRVCREQSTGMVLGEEFTCPASTRSELCRAGGGECGDPGAATDGRKQAGKGRDFPEPARRIRFTRSGQGPCSNCVER